MHWTSNVQSKFSFFCAGLQVSQADLDSYMVVDRHDVVDAIGSKCRIQATFSLALVQVSQADLDSYVVVDRRDVVDAIGSFVAAYLATLPEAQHMQPKQLQQALKQAFQVQHVCFASPSVWSRKECCATRPARRSS